MRKMSLIKVLCIVLLVQLCRAQVEDFQSLKGSLYWSDEFNSPDTFQNNWSQQVGGNGWGNNEAEYYTNNNQNLDISNDMLTIISRKEAKEGMSYTSARLQSKMAFRYGVFEMSAKLTYGRGTWPAFWLRSAKRPLIWPQDGEIDILEYIGIQKNIAHFTIHCKTYNHKDKTAISNVTYVDDVSNKFHLYQLYWTSDVIKGYVDNKLYFTYQKKADSTYDTWPFDNQYNIILNTAIGGDWAGSKGIDDSIFPQNFVIDYVRVYNLK